jgi:hypothetical protein
LKNALVAGGPAFGSRQPAIGRSAMGAGCRRHAARTAGADGGGAVRRWLPVAGCGRREEPRAGARAAGFLMQRMDWQQ